LPDQVWAITNCLCIAFEINYLLTGNSSILNLSTSFCKLPDNSDSTSLDVAISKDAALVFLLSATMI